jgi:hypothetical protein
VTGVFFNEQTPEHLAQAIDRFERQDWNPTVMRRHAQKFSVDVFRDRFRSFLKRVGAPVDIKSAKAVEPFLVKTAS